MKEAHLPVNGATDPAAVEEPDPRLAQARQVLGELEDARGADSVAPAKQLADLLEDLLEGSEGEKS